jgi:predicted unusual protein kinase regulating ubiquinone biosynthesis (AarF/ABC1/UbiB family)
VAWKYLQTYPNFIEEFYLQTKKIITFINKKGIHHNDAHLGNFVVDNRNNVYLTDFGLSMDKEFNLDIIEKEFFKNNKKLDVIYIQDNILSNYINKCLNNQKIYKLHNLDLYKSSIELTEYLLEKIDELKIMARITTFEMRFIKKNKHFLVNYIRWKRNFKEAKNKNNYYSNMLK